MVAVAEQKDPLTLIHGDALSSLRRLPDESVQCCVTSPPYWSLRDYGVEPLVWDETVECDHEWGDSIEVNATNHTDKRRWNHTRNGRDEEQPIEKRVAWLRTVVDQGNFCQGCGAWRGCLGLEPTPELYTSHIVQIFHELKRVLRSEGTLWLNLGDGYANDTKWGGQSGGKNYTSAAGGYKGQREKRITGLKPKDLIGIPWRVAFALQSDGWYLRSDIIWSKPNPMPESVLDRPTRSHEYIFLLSKSERYYYDANSIREPYNEASLGRYATPMQGTDRNGGQIGGARQPGGIWEPKNQELSPNPLGRNRRSVWTVTTKPFTDAHFATFPPDLITPCILAGAEAGATVIDPFAGSGTTGKVAIELGRKAILIEPKAEYVEMIKRRCQTTIGLPLAI